MIADAFRSNLQRYIDDVLDEAIPTSKAVYAAVRRHSEDLRRESTSDFPYHFSWKKAQSVCNFFPYFIRHSIGPFEGMPFDLSPWQLFCTSCIFGWLRDADETRRFRKTYRSMARKNGKSTWAAAEALYMAGFDKNPITKSIEAVAQVVLAATKRDQVDKVIFAEIDRMRRTSEEIGSRCFQVRREIRFPENNGEILTTSVDKPLDGLNPHCVVLDELHAWTPQNRPFFNTMMTGSGSRNQPLISFITTAGDDKSVLWQEEYKYAKDVVHGIVTDDRYFTFSAELDEGDDPFDPENWIKSNPNLGTSLRIETLKEQANEHKTTAIKTNIFTRYHGNRKVSSVESAFNLENWDACKSELSDWDEADVVCAGFDLGGYDDLAAYALVARFLDRETDKGPVYRYEVKIKSFISEKTQRDLTKQPFYDWIYTGLLQKTPCPNIDLRDALIADALQNHVRTIVFDINNARTIGEELEKDGFTAATASQNYAWFNEPIKHIREAINDGLLRHDGNPLLRWAISNSMLVSNNKGEWMYSKKTSIDKIDPVVAMTMAYRQATLEPATYKGPIYL